MQNRLHALRKCSTKCLYPSKSYPDFDLVVHLEEKDIPTLLTFFKSGYYIEEESIRDAIRRKSIFNIIDHQSGFKADFCDFERRAIPQN
jgi:hypothetical protein